MDLAQMRTQVRAFMDVDVDDLPDAVLDPWFQDGYSRIIRKGRKVWSWLQTETTVLTVPGTQTIDLDDVTLDIREVRQIWRPDGLKLAHVLHDRAHTQFSQGVGNPQAFSTWGRKVYLWPVPTDVETLSLIGYREPTAWYHASATDVPDCPEEYQFLMVFWATSMAAAQQEDLEVAAYHKGHFDEQLEMLLADDQSPNISQPIVLGGRRAVPFTPKYNIAAF